MHVFTQNGFEFKDAPNGDLLLTGIPYSKNTAFGKADVQELAQILLEGSVPVARTDSGTPGGAINVSDNLPRPSRLAHTCLIISPFWPMHVDILRGVGEEVVGTKGLYTLCSCHARSKGNKDVLDSMTQKIQALS